MSFTLAQIITTIRNRGNLRNTVRFPDSVITPEAQAAFGELYGLIVQHHRGFFDTDTTVPTVAAQAYVALPTGTWSIRAVDLLDGTRYVPLVKVGIKDRNRYGSPSETAQPVAYRRTARGIDLFPVPNAIYTLRITYTPVAPTLDSNARDYYNGWEEYVISGALIRLCGTQKTESSTWQKVIAATEARIINEASESTTQGPEYLNLYGDGDGIEDWDRPVDWSW
jgi:hypothetical protein